MFFYTLFAFTAGWHHAKPIKGPELLVLDLRPTFHFFCKFQNLQGKIVFIFQPLTGLVHCNWKTALHRRSESHGFNQILAEEQTQLLDIH